MEHLRKLRQFFRDKDHTFPIPHVNEAMLQHLEDTLLPHLLRVLQKDNTLIAEVELFPGIKCDSLWDGSDDAWKRLQMALLYAVLNGDPKEKFGKIIDTVKGLIPGQGAQSDEISEILNDEENQNSFKEILELLMNTRLASIVGEIAQSIQYTDLGIDFENPESLLEMMRNPKDSPALKELMERAQMLLEEKIRNGHINQQELVREIEMLRAKFQSAFGRYLNEMVVGDAGGGTTGNTGQQILSNSPQARHARMVARLQKRQKEKLRK
jgi:hypothetical protein